jgi:hypothetical protein
MDGALGGNIRSGVCKRLWISYHIIMSNANAMLFRSLPTPLMQNCDIISFSLVTVFHVNLIIWLFGFLCLVILNRIIDIAQDPANTILVLHIQL